MEKACFILVTFWGLFPQISVGAQSDLAADNGAEKMEASFNTPIIRDTFMVEPAMMVHHDSAYLYAGHDEVGRS